MRAATVFKSFIFLACSISTCYNARILASIPTASYSHQVAFRPIWKELAKRGHEIVLMTTDPMEDIENIKQIDMSFSYDIMKKEKYNELVTKKIEDPFKFYVKFVAIFKKIYFEQLRHPEVQAMIHNKSEQFDLLMIEVVFPIHLGLVERFKAPLIGLSSLDLANRFHNALGNAAHPVLHPDTAIVPYFYPLTLKERILSTIAGAISTIYGNYFLGPSLDSELQKIFGEKCRKMIDLVGEVDMMFMNVNPILHSIRALSPRTILFGGGFHVENKTKPLPKDLKRYLDNAENGIIYFSLGSNVKSHLLSDNLKKVFLETLSELPYKVLWKFETENLSYKPDNIWISKWFPQTDIFKHPNMKLFITQCGLQSMEEAIMHHIPMLGIPFLGDQPVNGKILENRGLGVRVSPDSLTKEIFRNAIEEVINNHLYKINLINTAELFTDVEMTGLEKVVWWSEYVIRNKGAKILKSTGVPFYQYYMLDVMVFILLMILTFLFLSKKCFSLFMSCIFRSSKKYKEQ
ncbi:hypothetical protein WA026_014801 [Henosepilachna vigintioctopunctata]|uniref:UDP-glucuronosyltransferase n=1 Tax=Henosepilachna vigintioctopunctata TaxID=420089 RepID=A0AAW1UU55_9CUCU